MTVIASKGTVEDSSRIAKSLAVKFGEEDDPRLTKLQEIIQHLDDLLNSESNQSAAAGATSVEDYFDDAKQPQVAAQVKCEVEMIAKWRREARPSQVTQRTHDVKVPPASDGQDSGKSSTLDAVSKKVDGGGAKEVRDENCSVPCHETVPPDEEKVWNPGALPPQSQHPDFEYCERPDRAPELSNHLESDTGVGPNNVNPAYSCDSCGRISIIASDRQLCHSCVSLTHILPEPVTEIPVPKNEFGTEFVAVVYRGRVVDLLLASGRSSVHSYLWGELGRVQDYVDRLGPTDVASTATTSRQTAVPSIAGGQDANRRAEESHRSGATGDTSAPAGTSDGARTCVRPDATTRARESPRDLIACDTKIPDYISPFVAYRSWYWETDGLKSLTDGIWPAGVPLEANANQCALSMHDRRVKTKSGAIVAKDSFQNEHIAPAEGCTCGIYAAKNFRHLRHIGYMDEDTDYGIHGEVYLWGRIWEHDLGYRAQFAYPKNLTIRCHCLPWSITGVQERLELLTQYGVDMYVEVRRVKKIEGIPQQTWKRIFLWSKEAGFNPLALDDLIADSQEYYTFKEAPISPEVGDTLAILGGGLGFIQEVIGEWAQVLTLNRKVRIHTYDVQFHKKNFRWETSSQGTIIRPLK